MGHVAAVLKYIGTIASRGVVEEPSPVILELDSFAKREAVIASKTLAANLLVGQGSSAAQEDVVMTPREEVVVVPSYAASTVPNKVRRTFVAPLSLSFSYAISSVPKRQESLSPSWTPMRTKVDRSYRPVVPILMCT